MGDRTFNIEKPLVPWFWHLASVVLSSVVLSSGSLSSDLLTAHFAQAKDAKKIDPAGSYIHPKHEKIFVIFAS